MICFYLLYHKTERIQTIFLFFFAGRGKLAKKSLKLAKERVFLLQKVKNCFKIVWKRNTEADLMIDINFLRANPDAVRENIRKKFQDKKLPS